MRIQRLTRIMMIPLIALIGLLGARPGVVHAQPLLVQATPGPDEILDFAPELLQMTFDRAVDPDSLWVDVTNGAGESMGSGPADVSRSQRDEVSMPLVPLPDGIYTVSYRVAAIGGSAAIRGEYTFTVDLPEPRLVLTDPVDGSALVNGPVDLAFEIESVSFDYYDTRIVIYLDGEKIDEIQSLNYTIDHLDNGVHEIEAILAQFDYELPSSRNIVRLAVHDPEPEPEELPIMGYNPDQTEWIIVVIVSVGIIIGGYFLGRKTRHLSISDDLEDSGS